MRAVKTRNLECALRAERRCGHPGFPMRADPMLLPVGADGSVATLADDIRQPLSDHRETVIGRRSQDAATRIRDQIAPRQPTAGFFILPHVGFLPEILFVPRTGAADD